MDVLVMVQVSPDACLPLVLARGRLCIEDVKLTDRASSLRLPYLQIGWIRTGRLLLGLRCNHTIGLLMLEPEGFDLKPIGERFQLKADVFRDESGLG